MAANEILQHYLIYIRAGAKSAPNLSSDRPSRQPYSWRPPPLTHSCNWQHPYTEIPCHLDMTPCYIWFILIPLICLISLIHKYRPITTGQLIWPISRCVLHVYTSVYVLVCYLWSDWLHFGISLCFLCVSLLHRSVRVINAKMKMQGMLQFSKPLFFCSYQLPGWM